MSSSATMAAARATATDHTPPTAESDVRAPARLGQESRVDARQDDEGHHEVDGDDDDQRKCCQHDRRRRLARLRVVDLGRIEGLRASSPARAPADRRRRRPTGTGCRIAEAFAPALRRGGLRAPATTGRSPA